MTLRKSSQVLLSVPLPGSIRAFPTLLLLLLTSLHFVTPRQVQSQETYPFNGQVISLQVRREGRALPVFRVPNLVAGDTVVLSAPQAQGVNSNPTWLLGLAFVPRISRGLRDDEIRVHYLGHSGPLNPIRAVVPPDSRLMVVVAPVRRRDLADRALRRVRTTLVQRGTEIVDLTNVLEVHTRRNALWTATMKALATSPDSLPRTLNDQLTTLAVGSGVTIDPACLTRRNDGQKTACVTNAFSRATHAPDGTTLAQVVVGGAYERVGGMANLSPYIQVAVVMAERLQSYIDPGQYEYIPAIPVTTTDSVVRLRLLKSPSLFLTDGRPLSVQVYVPPSSGAARPRLAKEPESPPVCLAGRQAVLPIRLDTATLAAPFGHSWTLQAVGPANSVRIPVRADEQRLRMVADAGVDGARLGAGKHTMVLRGLWGFDPVESDTFTVQVPARDISVSAVQGLAMSSGGRARIVFATASSACVSAIELQHGESNERKLAPVSMEVHPDSVVATWDLSAVRPDRDSRVVVQFPGDQQVVALPVLEPTPRVRLELHAGDTGLLIHGARAGLVSTVTAGGRTFANPEVVSGDTTYSLTLSAGSLFGQPGMQVAATLTLNDGRALPDSTIVLPPRPAATLDLTLRRDTTRFVLPAGHVSERDTVVLSFRTSTDAYRFSRDSLRVELRFVDEEDQVRSISTRERSYITNNRRDVQFRFATNIVFGGEFAGELQYRLVDGLAGASDWSTLQVQVVPTPLVRSLTADPQGQWTMEGSELHLIDEVDSKPDGTGQQTQCSAGELGCLRVPAPDPNGMLYVRLHALPQMWVRLRAR